MPIHDLFAQFIDYFIAQSFSNWYFYSSQQHYKTDVNTKESIVSRINVQNISLHTC